MRNSKVRLVKTRVNIAELTRLPAKSVLLVLSCLMIAFCAFNGVHRLDKESQLFKEYHKDFSALIEKEISKNSIASRPLVKVLEITESSRELKIKFNYTFVEKDNKGETVDHFSSGIASLVKNKEGTQWVLKRMQDLRETMKFSKGIVLGG